MSTLSVTNGLIFHLDATSLVLSDGEDVSTWNDLSDNKNHALVQDSSVSPQYIANGLNGKPTVRFFGGHSGFITTNEVTNVRTVFFVTKFIGTDYSDYGFILGSSSHSHWHGQQNDNVLHWYAISENVKNGSGRVNGVDLTSLQYLKKPSEFSILTITTAGAETFNTISNDRSIGRSWNGDHAEILVYNRVLTTQEIQDVEYYLDSKWINPILFETKTYSYNTHSQIGVKHSLLHLSDYIISSNINYNYSTSIDVLLDNTELYYYNSNFKVGIDRFLNANISIYGGYKNEYINNYILYIIGIEKEYHIPFDFMLYEQSFEDIKGELKFKENIPKTTLKNILLSKFNIDNEKDNIKVIKEKKSMTITESRGG